MTSEDLAAMGFMFFGLAFFLFIILITNRDNTAGHERRVSEMREFGFKESSERWYERRNRH